MTQKRAVSKRGAKEKRGKNGTTFRERVIRAALSVPSGRVTTYGRIARAAGGGALSAQSVTNILGKACEKGIRHIPFHRIVYANGRVWMSEAHRRERMKLYAREGIEIGKKGEIKHFNDVVFEFT